MSGPALDSEHECIPMPPWMKESKPMPAPYYDEFGCYYGPVAEVDMTDPDTYVQRMPIHPQPPPVVSSRTPASTNVGYEAKGPGPVEILLGVGIVGVGLAVGVPLIAKMFK